MWKQMKEIVASTRARPVLFIAGVLGIVLLLCGSIGEGCSMSQKGESITSVSYEQYRTALTKEAEGLCRRIKGAGEVHLVLTLEVGETNVYSGGHLSSTAPPRVLGVAAVADGAGSDTVRAEITNLLCALFRIGANRVYVAPSGVT